MSLCPKFYATLTQCQQGIFVVEIDLKTITVSLDALPVMNQQGYNNKLIHQKVHSKKKNFLKIGI